MCVYLGQEAADADRAPASDVLYSGGGSAGAAACRKISRQLKEKLADLKPGIEQAQQNTAGLELISTGDQASRCGLSGHSTP